MAYRRPTVACRWTLSIVVCCLVAGQLVPPRGQAQMADYEQRQAVLLQAILNGGESSAWLQSGKALASLYLNAQPSAQALAFLDSAAGTDPKCEQCCGPGKCGESAGYWCQPLLIRAYYTFAADATFEDGRYAGRIPPATAERIKTYYRAYLERGAGKGYANCESTAQPHCSDESTLHKYDLPPDTYISQTDNHTIIQAASILLATQLLRGESALYAQLYTVWCDWWSRFLDELARKGFLEVASPTYVERHLAPLYNLYDFAEDPLIRTKAEMLIDAYWAEIAPELLHGVRGGAKQRVYAVASEGDRGAISARNDAMYPVYYLCFGDSAFASDRRMPSSQIYNVIFATSSYRVPQVLQELATSVQVRGSYEVKERRKGKCFVADWRNLGEQPYNARRYSFVTPDYVLGSWQSDADKRYAHPGVLRSPEAQNSLVFATTADVRITWGDASYLTSPQVDTLQVRNVVLASMMDAAAQSLVVTLPPAGALDAVEQQGGWTFVREGNAYTAILTTTKTLVLEAACGTEYGYDWGAFKARVQATSVERGADYLQYTSTGGDVLWLPRTESPTATCRYSCSCAPSTANLPRINGVDVDWEGYALFDSPYVQSAWNSGLITVTYGARTLTLDFRDPEHPLRTEMDTSASTPTASATRSATATATCTPSATRSATATATGTPTATASATPTPTATSTPTATATQIPSPSATPTHSATPSATPTATQTETPTLTATPTKNWIHLPIMRRSAMTTNFDLRKGATWISHPKWMQPSGFRP